MRAVSQIDGLQAADGNDFSQTSGPVWHQPPGCIQVSQATAGRGFGNTLRWLAVPFLVDYPLRITAAKVEVTTAAAAGGLARPAIVTANTNWAPTTIKWQTSFDTTTTGDKSATALTVDLAIGRHLVMMRDDVATALYGAAPVNCRDACTITPGGGRAYTNWGSSTNSAAAGVWTEPLPSMFEHTINNDGVGSLSFVTFQWEAI